MPVALRGAERAARLPIEATNVIPLLRRADLLAGGFLLTFASSLGQTWFVALSGPALRAELGLGHGAFVVTSGSVGSSEPACSVRL
jgi:hypothetical protein